MRGNRKKVENVDLNRQLLLAVRNDSIDTARLSLEAGADVNACVDGWTPLVVACYERKLEFVRFLLEAGADPNVVGDRSNNIAAIHATFMLTAIHATYIPGQEDIVKLLLEHGADVNARDEAGSTPLHRACSYSRRNIARLLLEHGADVNTRNDKGITPFHYACEIGHWGIVNLLLKAGGDGTLKDENDATPLDYVMRFKEDVPVRERIINWYKEHHPELVMEAYCAPGPGGS